MFDTKRGIGLIQSFDGEVFEPYDDVHQQFLRVTESSPDRKTMSIGERRCVEGEGDVGEALGFPVRQATGLSHRQGEIARCPETAECRQMFWRAESVF